MFFSTRARASVYLRRKSSAGNSSRRLFRCLMGLHFVRVSWHLASKLGRHIQ